MSSTGAVRLGDRDLRGLPAYERARGGLTRTWQSTELFDDLSVFENLTVAARESGVTEDDAKQTLALVGMDWAAEAEPLQLSSGQRKLVGVSRALVAKPKLLCLDEPAPPGHGRVRGTRRHPPPPGRPGSVHAPHRA